MTTVISHPYVTSDDSILIGVPIVRGTCSRSAPLRNCGNSG